MTAKGSYQSPSKGGETSACHRMRSNAIVGHPKISVLNRLRSGISDRKRDADR